MLTLNDKIKTNQQTNSNNNKKKHRREEIYKENGEGRAQSAGKK